MWQGVEGGGEKMFIQGFLPWAQKGQVQAAKYKLILGIIYLSPVSMELAFIWKAA